MNEYIINVSIKSASVGAVETIVNEIFARRGFTLSKNLPAITAVVNAESMSEEDYGVIISDLTFGDWISVYVDDWRDSGVLMREISEGLQLSVIEIWSVEQRHCGYNYCCNGLIVDRFADDPHLLGDINQEITLLRGDAEKLTPVLTIPVNNFSHSLDTIRAKAGRLAAPSIDLIAEAIGLSFDQAIIGYGDFFDDDPEDYGPSLHNWNKWRHLTFRHPLAHLRLEE